VQTFSPSVVTLSTNPERGQVNVNFVTCSDVPGHWVATWRSGTFTEKHKQVRALLNTTTDHGVTERSKSGSLDNVSRDQEVTSQLHLYRKNTCMPLLHTSTQCPGTSLHVTGFTRPPPHQYCKQQMLHVGEKACVGRLIHTHTHTYTYLYAHPHYPLSLHIIRAQSKHGATSLVWSL